MKIKKSLMNRTKTLSLFMGSNWGNKKKRRFVISTGSASLNLGAREARMLHTFLNKVF